MSVLSDIKSKVSSGAASLKAFYEEASTVIQLSLATLGVILVLLVGLISLKVMAVLAEVLVFFAVCYFVYHLLGMYRKWKKTHPINKV